MMREGQMILDICGEEKKNPAVSSLLDMFANASGGDIVSDGMLL